MFEAVKSFKKVHYHNPLQELSKDRNRLNLRVGLCFFMEYLYYSENDEVINSKALPESQLINLNLHFNNVLY